MFKRRPLRAPTRLALILITVSVLGAAVTEIAFRKAAGIVAELGPEALSGVQRCHAMALISLTLVTVLAAISGYLVAWHVVVDPVGRILDALRSRREGSLREFDTAKVQPEMAEVAVEAVGLVKELEDERTKLDREHAEATARAAARAEELEALVALSSRIHGARTESEIVAETTQALARIYPGSTPRVVVGRGLDVEPGGLRVAIRGAHADIGFVRLDVADVPEGEVVERERIVEVVAHHVALAVVGLRTRAKLSEQSLRDPLTKLYNRRWLGDTLRREVSRSVRLGKPLAVLAFDVDHFKWFNDHFGHQAGDEVLKTVADTLASGIRAEDFACRQGGEEFLVVMPGADVATAAARAEALRADIARHPVLVANGGREPITVSVGVAVFPAHAPSADELLAAADAALYRAKASGRDRVVVVS